MPITDFLVANAQNHEDEVCLVEINPEVREKQRITWKDYSLVEPSGTVYRKELTWGKFDRRANRIANYLIKTGVRKGDKVAILLMNCIEWLPIYFGILKAGALAVPLNYRYSSDEIKYCLELADVDVLVFGKEFIGRVENICGEIPRVKALYYVGDGCPSFAVDFEPAIKGESKVAPQVDVCDDDYAAIYFSSGTTGFPKAILHKHRSLMHSAIVEQKHHGQTRDDVFLCIPPLYHTGAKMHWFGSLVSGSKAILLKGVHFL